jgi:hypothetical protein
MGTEDMINICVCCDVARNCECAFQFDVKYCCVLTNTNKEDVRGSVS